MPQSSIPYIAFSPTSPLGNLRLTPGYLSNLTFHLSALLTTQTHWPLIPSYCQAHAHLRTFILTLFMLSFHSGLQAKVNSSQRPSLTSHLIETDVPTSLLSYSALFFLKAFTNKYYHNLTFLSHWTISSMRNFVLFTTMSQMPRLMQFT